MAMTESIKTLQSNENDGTSIRQKVGNNEN